MSIQSNIAEILKRIEEAKVQSGQDVTLMAVTKKSTLAQTTEAISAGIRVIGENRVQAAAEKFPHLPPVEKHMIGHLQTNKVKHAVKLFDCIQSVDTLKLAKEIDKRTVSVMPVMIEVNVSGEEQKYGVPPTDVDVFYDKMLKLTNLRVVGLMTMAPYVDKEETRQYFKKLRKINETLGLKYLSMGMSNDFEVAVEEGSNLVRVGTAIFR